MKLVVALVLIGVALFTLPLMAERVRKEPDHIRVRVLDSFTVTVQRDSFPNADYLNGLVLAVGCGLAAMAALLIWGGALAASELQRFFLVTAIGLGLLALEETFELTETLAEKVGIATRRTDLILPVLGAIFLVVYRRVVLSSSRAVWVGAVGAALFALAVVIDEIPGGGGVEDPLEAVASLVLMSAFGLLSLDLLRRRPAEVPA